MTLYRAITAPLLIFLLTTNLFSASAQDRCFEVTVAPTLKDPITEKELSATCIITHTQYKLEVNDSQRPLPVIAIHDPGPFCSLQLRAADIAERLEYALDIVAAGGKLTIGSSAAGPTILVSHPETLSPHPFKTYVLKIDAPSSRDFFRIMTVTDADAQKYVSPGSSVRLADYIKTQFEAHILLCLDIKVGLQALNALQGSKMDKVLEGKIYKEAALRMQDVITLKPPNVANLAQHYEAYYPILIDAFARLPLDQRIRLYVRAFVIPKDWN